MKPVTSIVIPTFKRKESLLRLLASLAKANLKNTEIIIVEQEQNHNKFFPKSVHYIFLPKRSIPHAMNVGVRKAKGGYILFLDDDVTVTPNFIDYHIKNFADRRVAATVGRSITDGQSIERDRRDSGRINWLGECSDGFSSTIRQEVDTVVGANTSWRKDVFERLGGFDERFIGNALRFESDLSLRAKQAGYTIVFEPKALVYHHRESTGGTRRTEGVLRWYRDFFHNEMLFFVKYRPKLLLPLFFFKKILWVLTNL